MSVMFWKDILEGADIHRIQQPASSWTVILGL